VSWTKNNDWLKTDVQRTVSWGALRRFAANYAPFRAHLAGAALLALLGSGTAFLIPPLFQFVQRALVERDARLVAWAVGGYLAILLAEAAVGFSIRLLRTRVATRLNEGLLLQYYGKMLNLSAEEFIAFRQRSNLFQRVIDATSVTPQFTDVLIRGAQSVIVLVVVAFVIAGLSPAVLAVAGAGAAALFGVVLSQGRTLQAMRQRLLAVNYPLVGKMLEVIEGLFTIKALSASVKVTSDVRALVGKKADAEMGEALAEARSGAMAQGVRALTVAAAIGTSFALMMRGEITVAEVFALYVLTGTLLGPVSELAGFYQGLATISVNVDNYYEVLDLEDEERQALTFAATRRAERAAALASADSVEATKSVASVDSAAPVLVGAGSGSGGGGTVDGRSRIAHLASPIHLLSDPAERVAPVRLHVDSNGNGNGNGKHAPRGHVEFRDVDFAYRGGPPVITGLNLEILPGEKVSLIGKSGVGKTTLVRLLIGFLLPQKGTISVDGEDVASLADKNAFRKQFGVVSQRDFFFGTSLRENLCFGLDELRSDDDIADSLERVGLWDSVKRLPNGLATTFSEDLFSGGQKQRFYIARALLRRPAIVVLDEPTSALDFESEALVMKALDELAGGRTTITIAHRLSTVQGADRVIVIDDGRVKAAGPHRELYAADGYYRALCDYNSFIV
jgi:ABC-type bacteriocin/lantibiotic exporter with double-glycine peptidase domain